MKIPEELILHILHHLDTESLLQVSKVCTLLNRLANEKLKWLKLCSSDPLCQHFMSLTAIKEDLFNANIDARSFYESAVKNDINNIKSLLFFTESREFYLYAASYQKDLPKFFANSTRKVYLTEDAAKKNTPNAQSVKSWLKIKITLNANQFDELYTKKSILYTKEIAQKDILSNPSMTSKCAKNADPELSISL